MYPELVTRPDIKLFMPPIGGLTIYIWGDPATIPDEDIELTCRVHDECNGSDVFGSDICTCRPYLTHAIEECIRTAQKGGCGIVIYYRKEGRSLGEVTKYLVYNTRKRQEGGDSAERYFSCTEQVAGVQDTRFQALMPDPLHFLGVTKIHNFISMSDMKYDAIVATGIKIVNRVEIPPEMVPVSATTRICLRVERMSCDRTSSHTCRSFPFGFRVSFRKTQRSKLQRRCSTATTLENHTGISMKRQSRRPKDVSMDTATRMGTSRSTISSTYRCKHCNDAGTKTHCCAKARYNYFRVLFYSIFRNEILHSQVVVE